MNIVSTHLPEQVMSSSHRVLGRGLIVAYGTKSAERVSARDLGLWKVAPSLKNTIFVSLRATCSSSLETFRDLVDDSISSKGILRADETSKPKLHMNSLCYLIVEVVGSQRTRKFLQSFYVVLGFEHEASWEIFCRLLGVLPATIFDTGLSSRWLSRRPYTPDTRHHRTVTGASLNQLARPCRTLRRIQVGFQPGHLLL